MAYRTVKLFSVAPVKPVYFISEQLCITERATKRLIDKGRVKVNGEILVLKGARVEGEFEVLAFEPIGIGIKPIFITPDFAVFDKPSGVLVHPKNYLTEHSLLDDARALFGSETNFVHRIDRETSGLVICSRNKKSEVILKQAFEDRAVQKEYIAVVRGKLKKRMVVDASIGSNDDFTEVKIKSRVTAGGKPSTTELVPLHYDEKNDTTTIRALPLTGRLHQIRVHCSHIGHGIVGDTIYGAPTEFAARFLDGLAGEEERIMVTGADRLMLHASKICFEYKNRFCIVSTGSAS